MREITRFLMLLVLVATALPGMGQRIALRTNTLEWVALSPNLALEVRLSHHLTFDISTGGCPFTNVPIVNDMHWRHFRFTPELRYWFNRPMARHFLGINVSGAVFDLRLKDRCYKGDICSAGLDYGYDLVLSRRWNLEFLAGIGIGRARGYKFNAHELQPSNPNMSQWVPVPRAGVSFTYIL